MVNRMTSFIEQRHALYRLTMLLLLFGYGAMAWSVVPDTLRVLQGQAHYYYETDRYHDALASIAQWQSVAKAQPSNDVASQWAMKLLEASILLAMGLEQQAEAIMIDAQVAQVDQLGHAWFLLSRRWQQHGDWERALKTAELALAPRNQLASQWRNEAHFIQAFSYAQQL